MVPVPNRCAPDRAHTPPNSLDTLTLPGCVSSATSCAMGDSGLRDLATVSRTTLENSLAILRFSCHPQTDIERDGGLGTVDPKRLHWPIAVSATATAIEGKTRRLVEALRGLCVTRWTCACNFVHRRNSPQQHTPLHPASPQTPTPQLHAPALSVGGTRARPSLGLARLAQPISRNPPFHPQIKQRHPPPGCTRTLRARTCWTFPTQVTQQVSIQWFRPGFGLTSLHKSSTSSSWISPTMSSAARPPTVPYSGNASSSSASSSSSTSSTFSASDLDLPSSNSTNSGAVRHSMDSASRPPVQVAVIRCLRCARAEEMTSTDDPSLSGMVQIGTNIYYCNRCAKMVGYT